LDLCLRHFEQAIEAAEDLPFAELADELCEPPLAQPVGPELAADIAQHEFRGAAVGADEPLDIAVAPVGGLVAHGREVQPLVEGFRGWPGAAPGPRTADVALVRDRAAETEQLGFDEERRDDGNVGGVRAAALVRVIDDEGVPWRDATTERIDDG